MQFRFLRGKPCQTSCSVSQNGFGFIEILLSATLFSIVLLASFYYGMHSIRSIRNQIWETNAITHFSAFFERLQRAPNASFGEAVVWEHEFEILNQSLKADCPGWFAQIIVEDQQSYCALSRIPSEAQEPTRCRVEIIMQ